MGVIGSDTSTRGAAIVRTLLGYRRPVIRRLPVEGTLRPGCNRPRTQDLLAADLEDVVSVELEFHGSDPLDP